MKNQYKGKRVVVTGGRKVPHGTTGVVFWSDDYNFDRYQRWYNTVTKIGFKDSEDNVFWTYTYNVEFID